MATPRRFRDDFDTILAAGVVSVFLLSGVLKIHGGYDFVIETFGSWNFPKWTILALGLFEIAAAVATGNPRTRRWGAGVLALEMVGAMVYHVTRGETGLLAIPVVLFVASAAIAVRLGAGARAVPASSSS